MNFDTHGFKLGDRIMGRHTGCSEPSTIIGLVHAEATSTMVKPRWDELFPNWRDNMVAICKYDTPQKSLSFDEFKEQFNKLEDAFLQSISNDEALLLAYYKHVMPNVEIVQYPIEDLM